MKTELIQTETESIKDSSDNVRHFTDDSRLEKLDRLRQSIANKSYQVADSEIAEKIIDSDGEIAGKVTDLMLRTPLLHDKK